MKLDAELKDAININTGGTLRTLEIAKKFKNLKAFIHLSTAFCSSDIEVFEEKVYPNTENAKDVIDVAGWLRNDALVIATPSLIKPHPNTYTYSKRLAENLVANEYDNMRTCIVRPSIGIFFIYSFLSSLFVYFLLFIYLFLLIYSFLFDYFATILFLIIYYYYFIDFFLLNYLFNSFL